MVVPIDNCGQHVAKVTHWPPNLPSDFVIVFGVIPAFIHPMEPRAPTKTDPVQPEPVFGSKQRIVGTMCRVSGKQITLTTTLTTAQEFIPFRRSLAYLRGSQNNRSLLFVASLIVFGVVFVQS